MTPRAGSPSTHSAGPSEDQWESLKNFFQFLRPYRLDRRVCNPNLLAFSDEEKRYLSAHEGLRMALAFKHEWKKELVSPAAAVKEILIEQAAVRAYIVKTQNISRYTSSVRSHGRLKYLENVKELEKDLDAELRDAQRLERSSQCIDPKTGKHGKNRKYINRRFPRPKERLLFECQRLLAIFNRPHQGRTLLRFALAAVDLLEPEGDPKKPLEETALERSLKGLRSMEREMHQRARGNEELSRVPLWGCVLGPNFLTDSNALLPW